MEPNKQNRIKLALWFAIAGDLRYLPHRDTMRAWQRTLVRARLPLRYSQGFNPHLRCSLPLPRSVGMAGGNELLLVELTAEPDLPLAVERIGQQLPVGLTLTNAQLVPPGTTAQPQWAAYQLDLPDDLDRTELRRHIELFQNAQQWPVSRPPRGRHPARTIDLRRQLTHLTLTDEHLSFRVEIDPQATPRISEILAALHLDQPRLATRITRTKTQYQSELLNCA